MFCANTEITFKSNKVFIYTVVLTLSLTFSLYKQKKYLGFSARGGAAHPPAPGAPATPFFLPLSPSLSILFPPFCAYRAAVLQWLSMVASDNDLDPRVPVFSDRL